MDRRPQGRLGSRSEEERGVAWCSCCFALGCVIAWEIFTLATPGHAASHESSTSRGTRCLPLSMSAGQIKLDGCQSETPKVGQFINITNEEIDKQRSSETWMECIQFLHSFMLWITEMSLCRVARSSSFYKNPSLKRISLWPKVAQANSSHSSRHRRENTFIFSCIFSSSLIQVILWEKEFSETLTGGCDNIESSFSVESNSWVFKFHFPQSCQGQSPMCLYSSRAKTRASVQDFLFMSAESSEAPG